MTLSGSLGFVPLDEVLRLLTRAGNDGMVQISNSNAEGRIYVADKGVSLALTLSDEDLQEHLASSGYITRGELESIASGHARINEFFQEGTEGMALLREITVESLYQLDAEDSDFQVVKDATTPFASVAPFDLENILTESRDRAEQWAKVRSTISDLTAVLQINRELDSDTVELDREAWRIVSELGSGASVVDLARRLGTTEFSVARVTAKMAGKGLLFLETSESEASVDDVYASDVTDYTAPSSFDVAEAVETPESETKHDKSWWDESADELAVDEPQEISASATDEDEAQTARVSLDETVDSTLDGDEDDTEAFLEKVFSEVGSEADASEDGHGLMRRRRMGSILRDLGEE